jgi:hypothetical protein
MGSSVARAVTNVDECLENCQDNILCGAVNYEVAASQCWYLCKGADLSTRETQTGTNLYIMDEANCSKYL